MKPESYSLCEANIAFVRDQYSKDGKRNKSHWLDDLLTEIRTKSEKKTLPVQVNEDDVVVWLPLKTGRHPVMSDDVMQYVQSYQRIDIAQELRSMCNWIDANPSKRKTKTGIKRFINSWLSRANERGGSGVYQGDY